MGYLQLRELPRTRVREQVADDVVTAEEVATKFNGRRVSTVPLACTHLTKFIDVHDRLLYWCTCAWEDDFTGYVIQYGTFPMQDRAWFTLQRSRRTLRQLFPGKGEDGAIQAALEQAVAQSLQAEYPRTGGGVMRISRMLVDMGYKPGIVANAKHKVGGAAMLLARGTGITAGRKPMSTYRRKPGERHGHHWYMPNVAGTAEFPHVSVDVNYWKSFVHRGLATAAGERGCLSLYGKSDKAHELFAAHIAGSETWVETQGQGRTVREWRQRPSAPDNHWFDCLVGCAAAASMSGAATPGMQSKAQRSRKRYTQADLSSRPGAGSR